jgi:hypothetical protein
VKFCNVLLPVARILAEVSKEFMKALVVVNLVAKKSVVVELPLTNRFPLTLNLSFGVVDPIPTKPLVLMVRAGVVDVANVSGDEVDMYRFPPALRKDQ